MLGTIINVAIYGIIIIGLLDICLYISVKIKEKIRKKKNDIPDGAADHVVSASPSGMSDNDERTKKGA